MIDNFQNLENNHGMEQHYLGSLSLLLAVSFYLKLKIKTHDAKIIELG